MNNHSTLSGNITKDISGVVDSKRFSNLDPNIQKNVLDSITTLKQIESERGSMGKILGTKMPNMAIYSAFLLCCSLIIFVFIIVLISCQKQEAFILELIKIIIPVITMSLGYMFGKSHNDNVNSKDE